MRRPFVLALLDLTVAHFVHYVVRRLIEPPYQDPQHPWFAEHQPDDQGIEQPTYHVTCAQRGPAARVRRGDTIWLFSQLRSSWGNLPPSLDAKLVVSEVQPIARKGTPYAVRYSAAAGSCWYPLHDARDVIAQLQTVDSMGRIRPLLSAGSPHLGRYLQAMRQLLRPDPLDAMDARLFAGGFDFVSYRLVDGTALAFARVRELVAAGRAVFFDRWSLPRRLAERREFLRDEALDRHLVARIRACRQFWIIETPRYGEPGSYTARELAAAIALGKARLPMQAQAAWAG